MPFLLRPILAEMKAFYQQPISAKRFQLYLHKLQGDTKGDMILPVAGYNPMGKAVVLAKLEELEALGAEGLMAEVIVEINKDLTQQQQQIEVVLNLADDLGGAWTNRDTTDYDSKFNITALVKRHFCAPYFWTSESYNAELIRTRTKAYLLRYLYCEINAKPVTLEAHLLQEIYVAQNIYDFPKDTESTDFIELEKFYQKNKESQAYDIIFNFFYGDKASRSLGYKAYGNKGMGGFELARYKAKE